jgi:hypothetical protein
MAQIEVDQLIKVFRLPEKAPGFGAAVRHLFRPKYTYKTTVGSIRFSIEAGESVAYVGPNGAALRSTCTLARRKCSSLSCCRSRSSRTIPPCCWIKMTPTPPLSYFSPPAGPAMAVPASLVWSRCMVLYQGTGS